MPNVFSYCYVNKASKVFKFCVFPAMMDHITPVYFDLGVNSFISLERKDNINTGILVNSIIVNSKPIWKKISKSLGILARLRQCTQLSIF